MKNLDKRTILLISALIVIAVLVIVVSQTLEDRKGRFGVTTTAIQTETTVLPSVSVTVEETTTQTTAPQTTMETTTQLPTETEAQTEAQTEPQTTVVEEGPTSAVAEVTETTEATGAEASPVEANDSPAPLSKRRRIYTSFETDFGILTLEKGNTFRYTSVDDKSRFTGRISKIYSGENIFANTKITNRRLKKFGINPKTADIQNLYYVELRLETHEFEKDGQMIMSYYKPSVFRTDSDRVSILIYYDTASSSFQVYDINGDLSKMNESSTFYF